MTTCLDVIGLIELNRKIIMVGVSKITDFYMS